MDDFFFSSASGNEDAMDDFFFSSSSGNEEEEELARGAMLYWAFSPDCLDFLQEVPEAPPPPPATVSSLGPPLAEERTASLAPKSPFMKFTRPCDGPPVDCSSSQVSKAGNIHRRVIQLLRMIPSVKQESKASGGGRQFQHMMRERLRREKLSQSYADLYSVLSPTAKANKNSIVQSAAMYLEQLKKTKEQLRRRNKELRSRLARNEGRADGAEIRIRVGNPSSTIDSMIGALRCLKAMDVKASSIQSNFSERELSAFVSIEPKVATGDVEKAVEGALREVEQKLHSKLTSSSDFCTNVTCGTC